MIDQLLLLHSLLAAASPSAHSLRFASLPDPLSRPSQPLLLLAGLCRCCGSLVTAEALGELCISVEHRKHLFLGTAFSTSCLPPKLIAFFFFLPPPPILTHLYWCKWQLLQWPKSLTLERTNCGVGCLCCIIIFWLFTWIQDSSASWMCSPVTAVDFAGYGVYRTPPSFCFCKQCW